MAARHARTIVVAGVITGGSTIVRRLSDGGLSGGNPLVPGEGAAAVLAATGATIAGTFVVIISLQLFAEIAPSIAVGIAVLAAITAVSFAADDLRAIGDRVLN